MLKDRNKKLKKNYFYKLFILLTLYGLYWGKIKNDMIKE
jgi:hypothetical protein